MLKEISLKEALTKYLDGEEIQVLLSTTNNHLMMYKLNSLFKTARFLVEDENENRNNIQQGSISDKHNVYYTSNHDVKVDVDDPSYEETAGNRYAEKVSKTDGISGLDPYKKKGKKISIDLGKLYALKRAGWTQKDIACELGCSYATVNKYARNKELEDEIMNKDN